MFNSVCVISAKYAGNIIDFRTISVACSMCLVPHLILNYSWEEITGWFSQETEGDKICTTMRLMRRKRDCRK